MTALTHKPVVVYFNRWREHTGTPWTAISSSGALCEHRHFHTEAEARKWLRDRKAGRA